MKVFQIVAALAASTLYPMMASAQAAPGNQTAPNLEVGAVVYDTQGGEAAKIESVTGDAVVIDTGSNKATLPKTSFGKGAKGPVIGMTKAQLDAAVTAALAKTQAALATALVPGAEVVGKAGAPVGKVKEINGEQVVLDRPEGAISLKKDTFAVASGKLTLLLTAAELEAAVKAATGK